MDETTIDAYNQGSAEIAGSYRLVSPPLQEAVRQHLPNPVKVLDVGCGSGRDMAWLQDQGHDVHGIEPSQGMRAEALSSYPQLAGRISEEALPLSSPAAGPGYEAILCSAVLMHLPREEWFEAIYSMRENLVDGGLLLVSLSSGRQGLSESSRDASGRYYHEPEAEAAQMLFERVGFDLVTRTDQSDELGRDELQWRQFVFRKAGRQERPLDTIQSIIGREQKVATYKLALLRAFSEIALKEYNQVSPAGSGRVAIPVRLIAECWLRYYWPILAGDQFIPQQYGEKETGRQIAFRRELHALSGLVEGGYRALATHLAVSGRSTPLARAYRGAISKIRRAIIDGPVTHASHGTFGHDQQKDAITMPTELWREFTQLSPWIESAALLEWAQVTSSISRGGTTVADALSMLMEDYEPERDVYDARVAYQGRGGLHCVWSGKSIRDNRFDVDHAIPFSLWRCNDLWNLLPASPQVNNRKRDMLPTVDLVSRSSERIVGCWEMMSERHEARFFSELDQFIGRPLPRDNWQKPAISRLKEAVEVTAVQLHIGPDRRFSLC